MNWKLLGLVRVMHADGRDVSSSAAGRVGAEARKELEETIIRYGDAMRWGRKRMRFQMAAIVLVAASAASLAATFTDPATSAVTAGSAAGLGSLLEA